MHRHLLGGITLRNEMHNSYLKMRGSVLKDMV